ncbi:MAG: Xaa-Pro peptidase family protein [Muribaculaceae bacterium]|nr:Xaa-Pro peptidase family protein [Muribaculaceae bacterium]
MQQLVLLPQSEVSLRTRRLQALVAAARMDWILVSTNASKYYLTGRVFNGNILIPARGDVYYFVRYPVNLEGERVVSVRKPEEIAPWMDEHTDRAFASLPFIGVEQDELSYSMVQRLTKAMGARTSTNASPLIRAARSVKTPMEIDLIEQSGIRQSRVYSLIPSFYRPGMSDIELQIEIEHASRLEGCLGQFRISGDSMELFMGNVICGENADSPSPYDFAMGGAGLHPSLPVGADGTVITPGTTVMVDVNGNYTGYMTDMTRVFTLGDPGDLARRAHQCSIDIHALFCRMARPGVKAADIYAAAEILVRERDLHAYYMGHRQHAGFIGHGVGIEINELPVIAPRTRDILAENNVIALEPKFVIPHVGAVGIENTYLITADAPRLLTVFPDELQPLD